MRLRLPAAVVIFLGSYLPLSVILLAQDFDGAMLWRPVCWPFSGGGADCGIPLGHPLASLGLATVCAVCFGATLLAMRLTKAKRSIVVEDAKYVPAELIGYALPYVVAFMKLDFETSKLVALAIFLGWFFWITYRSGQIVLNPFLAAFGWRLYDVRYRFPGSSAVHTGKALCDDVIAGGDRCRHTMIDDVVIIRTKKEKGGDGDAG